MSRRYPRPAVPAAAIADDAHRAMAVHSKIIAAAWPSTTPDPEDTPMKIQFTSVHLHHSLPRLDAGKGQATQDSTYFSTESQGRPTGITIELDTASGIVCISKGTACHNPPREAVKSFGPTVEQAATHAKALAALAEATRRANEAAAAESEALAANPA